MRLVPCVSLVAVLTVAGFAQTRRSLATVQQPTEEMQVSNLPAQMIGPNDLLERYRGR